MSLILAYRVWSVKFLVTRSAKRVFPSQKGVPHVGIEPTQREHLIYSQARLSNSGDEAYEHERRLVETIY